VSPASGAQRLEFDPDHPENDEQLIRALVARQRVRLEARAGPAASRLRHYQRPVERPFAASDRSRVTILLGGLTALHDALLPAVFATAGYHCVSLPAPDITAFQLGRQYCNVGQCNPAYFTIGNLIKYLRELETSGLSRETIVDRFVFFTSGTCGPCRFGMYEAEYRMALQNAGFDGFRVLTFLQNDGVKARSGQPGLTFSVHFAMSALNSFVAADVVRDVAFRIRPYETHAGDTNRAVERIVQRLDAMLRARQPYDVLRHAPSWLASRLATRPRWCTAVNTPAKMIAALYGRAYADALRDARSELARIEVDRLRVKPIVKVTGEFWAQTTEGAGNFDMFAFLEREGAEVLAEPVGGWVTYLLYQARARMAAEARAVLPTPLWHPSVVGVSVRLARKWLLLHLGEAFWRHEYTRNVRALGDIAEPLVSQAEVGRLAHPFYHRLSRGGEGHLEVGKTIYYTTHRRCHMVLSLKPFGCLPSTQSDGVQSAVAGRIPELNFLSVETSGEGELNAHSRVQMALGEAKAAARLEFDRALDRCGRSLDDIGQFVAEHPELRQAFYRVPRRRGVAGVAASMVLHVGDLMARQRARWHWLGGGR
jgi:predicted nucleotide-binding protein (sugar kinase/HSP70/actin superfamily)